MDLLFYVNEHILIIAIMFARISGLFLSTPIYSSKFVPSKIKLLLALFMSIILAGNSKYSNDLSLYSLFWSIFFEFTFGYLIGFISSLFLKSINVFGACVDYMMGFGMMSAVGMDGPSDSISAILIEYLSILLFFILQGHIHIFYIISQEINLANFIAAIQKFEFSTILVDSFNFIIINGINFAIPFLLIFLIIDLCLGVINKSYPSFNVFLFSIPVKSILFIILLLYYVFMFSYNFNGFYEINLDFLNTFLKSF